MYAPEQHVWPLVDRMLAAGLSGGIALATDMAEHSMWDTVGPVGFISGIREKLAARGATKEAIAQVIGGNIACRLATSEE